MFLFAARAAGSVLTTLAQVQGFTMDSYINLAVLVVLLGGVVKVTTMLNTLTLEVKKLKKLPAEVRHISDHLLTVEEDMNNLFAATRVAPGQEGRLAELTRRSRFRPYHSQEDGE